MLQNEAVPPQKTHHTVSGHTIELDASPKVTSFLDRLRAMVDDQTVSEQAMIGLAYSTENPFLDHAMFPGRGAVTKDVLANPAYAVMTDLLFRKHVAIEGIDVEKLAKRYSMSIAEAAAELGIHVSAVRQAIAAKRLASWMKDGRHYLDPRDVKAFQVGTRGPEARVSIHGPLEVCVGHKKGVSFSLKAPKPIVGVRRVEGNVMTGVVREWHRVVVRTTSETGSVRSFVLEPAKEPNTLTFNEFYVRGNFDIVEKANSRAKAEELWSDTEVS